MYTETVSSQYIFYAPHHNSHFAWRTQVKKTKPVCICECVCVCVWDLNKISQLKKKIHSSK